MDLQQVIALLNDWLQEKRHTGVNAPIEAELFSIARDVWIEHQSIPLLPVTYIIERRVTGQVSPTERDFWRALGLGLN